MPPEMNTFLLLLAPVDFRRKEEVPAVFVVCSQQCVVRCVAGALQRIRRYIIVPEAASSEGWWHSARRESAIWDPRVDGSQ